MKPRDLKKEKWLRFLFGTLHYITAFGLPLLIVAWKYNLFQEYKVYKLSVIAIIICLCLLFKFRKSIIENISKWQYSVFKHIILGINDIAVWIIIVVILLLAQEHLETLTITFIYIGAANTLAYMVFLPLYEKFNSIIEKETRKNEMREVLTEHDET